MQLHETKTTQCLENITKNKPFKWRFIKAIWTGGNQSTWNPFTGATRVPGGTSFPSLFEAAAMGHKEPPRPPRAAPAKGNMEAGAELRLLRQPSNQECLCWFIEQGLKTTHPQQPTDQPAQQRNSRHSKEASECQLCHGPLILSFSVNQGSGLSILPLKKALWMKERKCPSHASLGRDVRVQEYPGAHLKCQRQWRIWFGRCCFG